MRKWSEMYFFFFFGQTGQIHFRTDAHTCMFHDTIWISTLGCKNGWLDGTNSKQWCKTFSHLVWNAKSFLFSPSFSLYLFQPLQTSFYLTPLLSLFAALLMLHSIARWSIVQSGYFSTSNLNVSQLGTVRTPAANGCLCVKSQNFTGNWSNELTHTRRERRIGLTLHSCKDFYEAHINWTGRLRTQMPQ